MIMKNVLILGAGMVSRPIVRYLLNQKEITICMASRTISKAEYIIDNHPNGKAISLNISDDNLLEELIAESDVVVSLLPYMYHVKVAKYCIKHQKHLVTTSYVSEEMRELDQEARDNGILLLNECGLDPGIDHMSAMRVIHQVKENHGKITSFRSTTGALPSHEANTNPFGYKFSWSPLGVLLASRNPAQWLEHGKIIRVSGEKLFENYYLKDVEGVGTFENYPNRDSEVYKELYGLDDAETVYRGTFRMVGWCETLRAISQIGWLKEKVLDSSSFKTYASITRMLINASETEDLVDATARFLDLKRYSAVIKRLNWLGLFDDIPLQSDKNTPIDHLNVLTLEKMSLSIDERDMIVMHHEFIAEYSDKKEYITSTLLNYGIPGEDSAVARTVALPAAIAVKMILDGVITRTGVHIPIDPNIYNPILDELESLGVVFKERINCIS
jgi:saccharopine dehydrogenase-like NADP-dependent oxidoreductase